MTKLIWDSNDFSVKWADANRVLVTLKSDGTIEYGPGVTPDAAAREFWERVIAANPLRAEVERLQAELREIAQALTAERLAGIAPAGKFRMCTLCHMEVDIARHPEWAEPEKLATLHTPYCPVTKARALLAPPHPS